MAPRVSYQFHGGKAKAGAAANNTVNTPGMITNVTGSVTQGSTLTITGTTLVNEDQSNWDAFWQNQRAGFEGTDVQSDWGAGFDPIDTSAYVYDSTVKLMGSQSLKTLSHGQSGPYPSIGGPNFAYPPPTDTGNELWLRLYSRWHIPGDWPGNIFNTNGIDMKFVWFGQGGGGSASSYFLNWEVNADKSRPNSMKLINNSGTFAGLAIPSGTVQDDRWYLIEMGLKWQSGSAPYQVKFYIDNTLLLNTTSDGIQRLAGGGAFWAFDVNWWDTDSNFDFQRWSDGFAFSSSRVGPASLIEIGTSPTFTTKLWQPPVYLSDTSCQCMVDLTGLGAGPYYLRVTNNRGTVSNTWAL